MASIRALCTKGVLLEKGMVKYIGDVNDTVDLYISNAVHLEGEPIIDAFIIHDPNLTITNVVVNEQRTNLVNLHWPARKLNVVVEGKYNGSIPMDLELSLYTENEVLVAKKTPSLSTGETADVNNETFRLEQTIELPSSFTNGVYYMRIDLTHPKISYLAQANNAVQLTVDGNYTEQGIPIEQRYFGLMYL